MCMAYGILKFVEGDVHVIVEVLAQDETTQNLVRVSSAGAACFRFEGVPHAARLLKVQSLQQFEELVWRFRGVTRRSQNANPVAQCVPALLILPILEEF